jgi:hypothetical protein
LHRLTTHRWLFAAIVRRVLPVVVVALVCAPAASAWSWPLSGPLLQPFTYDESHPYAAGQHRGIDIGAEAAGQAVLAPAGGTVSFAGTVPTSGACVTIETPDGFSVTLTHLGSIRVGEGDVVAEGDEVGAVGPSGTPEHDEPYVHLGVRRTSDPNGYLDPLAFLPPLAPPGPGVVSSPESAPVPAAAAGSTSSSQRTPSTPSHEAPMPAAAAASVSAVATASGAAAVPEPAFGTASTAVPATRPLGRASEAQAGRTSAASGARTAPGLRAGSPVPRTGSRVSAAPAPAWAVPAAVAAGTPTEPGRAAPASRRRSVARTDARRFADSGALHRPAPVASAGGASSGRRLRRPKADAPLGAPSRRPTEPVLAVVLAAAPGVLVAMAALLVAGRRRRSRTGVPVAAGVVPLPPRVDGRQPARRAA